MNIALLKKVYNLLATVVITLIHYLYISALTCRSQRITWKQAFYYAGCEDIGVILASKGFERLVLPMFILKTSKPMKKHLT